MPPHQQYQLGSSRLGQIQLMISVRFTPSPNSTVPKSLVHARVVTHRSSVHLRTARLTSGGAQYRRFRNRLEYGSGTFPRAASRHWGVWGSRARDSAAPCMRALHPCLWHDRAARNAAETFNKLRMNR